MRFSISACALVLLCMTANFAQETTVPFNKGVNLTNWFQESDVRTIQLYKYPPETFDQIRSLGCDVVRLPVNLHPMCGPAPDFKVPQLLYQFLDSVSNWAADAGIQLIIDNHTFDPSVNTDPSVEEALTKVWPQIAYYFRGRADHVHFEVLNEPHGIGLTQWNAIQGRVIETIRAVDMSRSIIVGAANWNSFHDLKSLPDYDDPNLIYTFHFYDPFLLTHQGATWVEPSMDQVRDIPFPYSAAEMPEMPDQYAGTWIANHYESYPQEGTAERIRQLLDIAVAFQEERNVPLFCGEFGVYQPFSDPDDRNTWYEVVRTKLEDHQIAWTMWDYHGGFGIFTPGGQGLFDHDLDIPLVNALGLNAPDQHPFEIKPDESGFVIYDDFIGQDIEYAGYSSGGMVDLYGSQAHNGQFAIEWNNPGQYSHIGFNFRPDKDLSLLVQAGYRIEFAVKGELPNTPFDIRFVDSKVDAEDHPWRMRYICDDELFVRDGEWHMISIPLSELEEHGSWDNNTWYEPEGLFDWTAIDRFEIVAEYTEAEAGSFTFDDIKVTGGATSTVQDYMGSGMVTAYPNPTSTTMQIVTTTPESGYIEVIGSNGIIVSKVACRLSDRIEIDLRDLPPGNYVVHRVSGDDVSIGLIPIIKI